MTRKREYVDYLRDMIDAAEKAERFVAGMEFPQFEADEKTVYAVIRALEIIGEAAKHVPGHLRRKYPEAPRREMAGMRDKVTHEYFGVNLRRAFDTVRQDLPALRTAIARILSDLEPSEQQRET